MRNHGIVTSHHAGSTAIPIGFAVIDVHHRHRRQAPSRPPSCLVGHKDKAPDAHEQLNLLF